MPAVVSYVKKAGPDRGINVDAMAGRVTMDAISLAIFGQTRGHVDDIAADSKPAVAEVAATGGSSGLLPAV